LTRSGSRYELGDIDPEYEKIYPNARKRLLGVLGEQCGRSKWVGGES